MARCGSMVVNLKAQYAFLEAGVGDGAYGKLPMVDER
jgi:hypothetical protein